MTDKEQIMIDGVDVSGCELYGNLLCNTDSISFNCLLCSDKPNCYFKQLARKVRECEELKEDLWLAKQLVVGILKAFNLESYDWLADQNEIATEIENLKTKFKTLQENNFLVEQESINKSTALYNLEIQSDRYRKALEEIEKFIKNRKCKYCSNYKDAFCPEWYGEECDMKDVLDIINKVKGEG